MRNTIIFIIAILTLNACHNKVKYQNVGKVKNDVVSVASKVPGRVIKYMISESDYASKGDTLALIAIPDVEAKLKQAKGALYSAEAQYQMALNGATENQLKQINAKYEATKEQYEFARKSYNRISNLYTDSLVSAQKHDEVYMKYQGAKAQFEATEAQREEAMKGVRNEKVKMAYGQMMRAEGAVQEATVAYNERYVVAPKDMQIQTIALRTGELALPGYTLFTGYESNSTYFRFTLPESSAVNFKTGMQVTVNIPFENRDVKGTIYQLRQLPRYAQKASAFPNYELGEAIYEIRVKPADMNVAKDLLTETTAILNSVAKK